jgi:hypothetical protein
MWGCHPNAMPILLSGHYLLIDSSQDVMRRMPISCFLFAGYRPCDGGP